MLFLAVYCFTDNNLPTVPTFAILAFILFEIREIAFLFRAWFSVTQSHVNFPNILYKMNSSGKKLGSRKVAKKVANAWTEEDLLNAIHALDSVPGSTIRGVAKQFGVGESTIRFRLSKRKEGKALGKAGRKCVFSENVEKNLAECISVVCNYGFSPTMFEVIVSIEFVFILKSK